MITFLYDYITTFSGKLFRKTTE